MLCRLQALKYATCLAVAGTLALILSVSFGFEEAAWCGNHVLEPHEACDGGPNASVSGDACIAVHVEWKCSTEHVLPCVRMLHVRVHA